MADAFNPYAPRGRNSAGRTYEALTRAQWDEYMNTFVPMENDLIAYATDPAEVERAQGLARFGVRQSFDMQQGIQQRRNEAMGVDLSAEESQVQERQMGLQGALAEVNAANLVGRRVRDRQDSVLGNPVPSAQGLR